jgi:hypothetical protein
VGQKEVLEVLTSTKKTQTKQGECITTWTDSLLTNIQTVNPRNGGQPTDIPHSTRKRALSAPPSPEAAKHVRNETSEPTATKTVPARNAADVNMASINNEHHATGGGQNASDDSDDDGDDNDDEEGDPVAQYERMRYTIQLECKVGYLFFLYFYILTIKYVGTSETQPQRSR